MLPSIGTRDYTLGTTRFEDGAVRRASQEAVRLQARQDQSLKQGRASKDGPGGPEGRTQS